MLRRTFLVAFAVLCFWTTAMAAVTEPTAPLLPLQASFDTSEATTVSPALTSNWAFGVVGKMIFATSLSTAVTTSNISKQVFDWQFNTTEETSNLLLVSQELVIAIAGASLWFIKSNATRIWIASSFNATAGQSFKPYDVTSTPLVQSDVLYIGTSDTNLRQPVFYALNSTTGVEKWRYTFDGIRYANMKAVVSESLNRVCAQCSSSGSDSEMFVFTLTGTFTNLHMFSTDSPANRGYFISTGLYVAVMFAVSFFDLTNSSAPKIGGVTYSNLQCSMLEPVRTPVLIYNGIVYSTCLQNIFGISSSSYSLVSTTTEPNSVSFKMGVASPLSSDVAFLATEKGGLYRFNAATEQLTSLFQEPYVPQTGFALLRVRLFSSIVSSASITTYASNPNVLLVFRSSPTLGAVRAINPWNGQMLWNIVDRSVPADAVSNGNFTAVYQGVADSVTGLFTPLRLYTAVPLVSQNITTDTAPTVASAFTTNPRRADLLGAVALPPGSTQGALMVYPDGLYKEVRDSSIRVCSFALTRVAAPPALVSSRWMNSKNITFNVNVTKNQTVNVTISNTSLQNVTIVVNSTYNYTELRNVTTNTTSLVNQTVNVTEVRWRLENSTVGASSACVIDSSFILRCYNLSTEVCSTGIQLCEGGGMLSNNTLRPLNGASGQLLWFCTGSADRAFDLVDVTTNTLTKFGTSSGGGVLGAWSSSLRYAVVAVNTTTPSPTDRRRWLYRLERYDFSSTTPVWTSNLNVPVLSNLALVEAEDSTNAGISSAALVYFVSFSISRQQHTFISVFVSNGIATYASPDVAGRRNTPSLLNMIVEPMYWLGAARIAGYTYCFIVGRFTLQSVNGTVPLVERVPLTVPTYLRSASYVYPYGSFVVSDGAPLLAADLGVLVVAAENATLSLNLYTGALLWASKGPSVSGQIVRQWRSVALGSGLTFNLLDLVTGKLYFSLGTFQPTSEDTPPNLNQWSIAGPSNGEILNLTVLSLVARNDEALYTSLFQWKNVSTEVAGGSFVTRVFHTLSPSQSNSPSASVSFVISLTLGITVSTTLSRSVEITATPALTETWNPLESRTRRPTRSQQLSLSKSTILSPSVRPSDTYSLPIPIPTRTSTNSSVHSLTVTQTVTQQSSKSASMVPSTTIMWTLTDSSTTTQEYSKTMTLGVTRTASLRITASHSPPPTRTPGLTQTNELIPTATRHTDTPYDDDPPAPAAAPNVLASTDYSFIVGPVVAFVVVVVVLFLAVAAKKRRKKKKAERIFREEQERLEREQEMRSYEPPPPPARELDSMA